LTVGAANLHDVNVGLPLLEADFSSRGPTQDGFSKPDLMEPGISIVSNRAPGSTVDMLHPDARVSNDYFKGTGSSQATAVVSGTGSRPHLIVGEVDALGNQWVSRSWRAGSWYSSPWAAYTAETLGWNATAAWSKKSWSGASWDDSSWDKKSWTDAGWSYSK